MIIIIYIFYLTTLVYMILIWIHPTTIIYLLCF